MVAASPSLSKPETSQNVLPSSKQTWRWQNPALCRFAHDFLIPIVDVLVFYCHVRFPKDTHLISPECLSCKCLEHNILVPLPPLFITFPIMLCGHNWGYTHPSSISSSYPDCTTIVQVKSPLSGFKPMISWIFISLSYSIHTQFIIHQWFLSPPHHLPTAKPSHKPWLGMES